MGILLWPAPSAHGVVTPAGQKVIEVGSYEVFVSANAGQIIMHHDRQDVSPELWSANGHGKGPKGGGGRHRAKIRHNVVELGGDVRIRDI